MGNDTTPGGSSQSPEPQSPESAPDAQTPEPNRSDSPSQPAPIERNQCPTCFVSDGHSEDCNDKGWTPPAEPSA